MDMKILLVHNSYQQPGGEDVVFEQELELLKRAGHTVIAYRRSNWEVDAYQGIRRLDLMRNTIWSKDTRKEFSSLLLQERPKLVHVHNTFVMVSPSIYSACQEAGVPVVQTLHNYRLFCPAANFFRDGRICKDCVEHSLVHAVKHRCYRGSRAATATVALMLAVHRQRQTWIRDINRYIVPSAFARTTVVEAGLPANKVFVKPNFVHPDPGARANLGGDHVLFVGRLSPEKRVSTLLAAWTRIRQRIPLVIIGGGSDRPQLEREAVRENLDIRFHGQMPRQQTLAAIRQARFLVFPSEWYETFAVTIAEAFACGVPVICSRLGAMQEIVEDGRTGLHFTPGDADDLAEKVDWAWNHPERMQSMAKEARKEYENKYTAEKNYPRLMEIYECALKNAVPTLRMTPSPQQIPGLCLPNVLK
jgi:glycosyltransferase involved in cell wall biosynthesis